MQEKTITVPAEPLEPELQAELEAIRREFEYITELRRRGRGLETAARRECREGGCWRQCRVYWGKKCKHLGGKKVPCLKQNISGRIQSWI